jgi:DNA replication protein DnaC
MVNQFITGKPGVGKTYLAKVILQENIDNWNRYKKARGVDGFSLSRGEDIFKLYNCSEIMMYSRIAKESVSIYKECCACKGLVLDDLGLGKKSDFAPDLIYMIIDKRIELGKPTVVTSNLSLSQISQLIDDRLASRLASFELIEMKGEDKRLTGLFKPKIVNF